MSCLGWCILNVWLTGGRKNWDVKCFNIWFCRPGNAQCLVFCLSLAYLVKVLLLSNPADASWMETNHWKLQALLLISIQHVESCGCLELDKTCCVSWGSKRKLWCSGLTEAMWFGQSWPMLACRPDPEARIMIPRAVSMASRHQWCQWTAFWL